MSPLHSSSNVEKVGGGLNMVVKEKKLPFLNRPDAAEYKEYKVGFELMSGARVIGFVFSFFAFVCKGED